MFVVVVGVLLHILQDIVCIELNIPPLEIILQSIEFPLCLGISNHHHRYRRLGAGSDQSIIWRSHGEKTLTSVKFLRLVPMFQIHIIVLFELLLYKTLSRFGVMQIHEPIRVIALPIV
jgi:hypothetical protein